MLKDKEKRIPVGNYIKLGLIILATVLLAIFLRNSYISNQEYENGIPIIRDAVVSEINSNEVYHYVRENEQVVLYIGVSNDKNCRNLETDLKEVITSRHLENVITYLNLTNNKKKSSFIKEFNKFYDTKLLGYPSFVFIEDGKVMDIMTVKTGNKISVDRVINFLERNNISSDLYD